MAEKAKEHERNLEDEKSRHEAEMEAMNRRHQKVVADLDEKVAEIEKVAEQLKNDKKALQTALANDSDQRNQVSLRVRWKGRRILDAVEGNQFLANGVGIEELRDERVTSEISANRIKS